MQFDNAVTLVGGGIEAALQETVKVGSGKETKIEQKYYLDDLLSPDFRLPAPKTREERQREAFRAFAAMPGVRVIKGTA